MEVPGPALREQHIPDPSHLTDRTVDLGLIRCAHQELMLIAGRQDTMVDGILLAVHPGKLHHGLPAHRIVGPRDIDERTLVRDLTPDIALDHDLSVRNPDTVCASPDGKIPAHELSRIGKLPPLRDAGGGRKRHKRMGPHRDRDRETLPPGKRLRKQAMGMPPLHKTGHHTPIVEDHHTVDGSVLDTVKRRKYRPSCKVSPRIPGIMLHHREAGEIDWDGALTRPGIPDAAIIRHSCQTADEIPLPDTERLRKHPAVAEQVHHRPVTVKVMEEEYPIGLARHAGSLVYRRAGSLDILDPAPPPHII